MLNCNPMMGPYAMRSRNPYILLVSPAIPDILKVKFNLISISHTLCQFMGNSINILRYIVVLVFHSCVIWKVLENSKKRYSAIKVLSSTRLTLLHSTKSPKFIEHFNHSQTIKAYLLKF